MSMYAKIEEVEPIAWTPTAGLRFYDGGIGGDDRKRLQQLWQASNGSREWRDVPIVYHHEVGAPWL